MARSWDIEASSTGLLDRNRELAALVHLSRSIGLRLLGCRFERGLTGSVIVIYNNRPLGTWWFQDGAFLFGRMARTRSAVRAQSVDDVVSQTIRMIGRRPVALDRSDAFGNR